MKTLRLISTWLFAHVTDKATASALLFLLKLFKVAYQRLRSVFYKQWGSKLAFGCSNWGEKKVSRYLLCDCVLFVKIKACTKFYLIENSICSKVFTSLSEYTKNILEYWEIHKKGGYSSSKTDPFYLEKQSHHISCLLRWRVPFIADFTAHNSTQFNYS